jgi:hypothetical protein
MPDPAGSLCFGFSGRQRNQSLLDLFYKDLDMFDMPAATMMILRYTISTSSNVGLVDFTRLNRFPLS